MAPIITSSAGFSVADFSAKLTWRVLMCGIIASTGGLMFGYDIGVSGGVSGMDTFLKEFFPKVYLRKQIAKENNYCKYDNQLLQLFTSSLYLAALVMSFYAATMCKKFGRKVTMQAASVFFLVGALFTVAAHRLWMLIIGRILLGFGVGCGNQAVPLFISEIAPVKFRGALNICFQLMITIGILLANIVNYYTAPVSWGWRLSLGLAGVPALILMIGSFSISETPTSLVERGKLSEGRAILKAIRGVENVDLEFEEIQNACEIANRIQNPFKNLMKTSSRPQLVIGVLMQVFQQFTGINAIMFYAPVLFQTIGFKNDAALLSAVITGTVNVLSTLVSIALVDRAGRRSLLLEACVQMGISQAAIGAILATKLSLTGSLDHGTAIWVVLLICLFVSGFAWSWGPLGWLVASEIFPLKTRAAGFSFAVSSNMLFTAVIAQSFLSMMCKMRAGIFFFFLAWIVVMGLFVVFLLPETKQVPIDEMGERVWKQHWYWKRFMVDDDDHVQAKKAKNLEKGVSS
ncbi:sugar transport protein 8-like [Aristolochia californica]|uniref:sugar transport protein 8-like n=1 Tax=Aristolochia californica TaxID=171875 RepID=UPI0035DE7358